MEITLDRFNEILSGLYSMKQNFRPGESYTCSFVPHPERVLSSGGTPSTNVRYEEIRFVRTPDGWSLESKVKIVSSIHP